MDGMSFTNALQEANKSPSPAHINSVPSLGYCNSTSLQQSIQKKGFL